LDFEFGLTVDGGWEIDGRRWPENPLIVLPAWVWPVVDLWLLCRRHAGIGGAPLPCPGSVGEQPAALMDAFRLLDRAMQGKSDA
jgi:hypothetical protein